MLTFFRLFAFHHVIEFAVDDFDTRVCYTVEVNCWFRLFLVGQALWASSNNFLAWAWQMHNFVLI